MEMKEMEDYTNELTRLKALNSSLEARIMEFETIVLAKDAEIALLQTQIAEATVGLSNESKILEEKDRLENRVHDLSHQASAAKAILAESVQVNFGHSAATADIDQLQQNLSTMQLELQQLQLQLQDVSQQNLILQQQTVRLAALEILQDSASGDLSIPLKI
jgi:chromosome segregation ATPase